MVDTFISPILTDIQLPSDGDLVIQPKEQTSNNTLSSPIIPDKELGLIEEKTKLSSSGSTNQIITGLIKVGNFITLDSANGRIIVNDGVNDRIIIGFYPE